MTNSGSYKPVVVDGPSHDKVICVNLPGSVQDVSSGTEATFSFMEIENV